MSKRKQSSTLVEVLRWRAFHQPERPAYTFLTDEEQQKEVHLTYGELDRRARAIAALLQSLGATGERALLLHPAGLDYLVALFGCLYAKVIAVPAYPPDRNTPFVSATERRSLPQKTKPRFVCTRLQRRSAAARKSLQNRRRYPVLINKVQ